MNRKQFLLISPMNVLGEGSSFPPLGLATIARHIPDDYDVSLIDEGVDGLIDPKAVSADIVGISVNTFTAKRAYEISGGIMKKNIPAVLGGIHPTVVSEEAVSHATSIVIGNGESIIEEIVHDFEKGKMKKIYDPDLFDISKSLVPKRSLFNKGYRTGNIQTSRGCPFTCKFCSVHKVHGNRYRPKPLDVVDRDLQTLDKSIVLIVDDNVFGVGRMAEERFKDLLGLLKYHKIRWIGQASINIAINEKILAQCRESGAIAFYIGFESLNEGFLKSSGKVINLKQTVTSYRGVIDRIHDNGICVLGSFIYGTDFDTRDSLKVLRDFIVESNIDATYAKPLTPLPGTDIYNDFKSKGRLFNPSYWMEDPYPVFTFKPKKISMDDLKQASSDFMELYTLPKSVLGFGKSILKTGNFWGSAMSFFSNYGDYRMYKSHSEKMKQSQAA